ncbi:hypothetical protein LDC_2926 [sediment metagenome]|uniref:Uncharacterized protein n=1 Tax=sediment metagenome TaxID=749907 RepID=D9PMZ7_9ZZZZ
MNEVMGISPLFARFMCYNIDHFPAPLQKLEHRNEDYIGLIPITPLPYPHYPIGEVIAFLDEKYKLGDIAEKSKENSKNTTEIMKFLLKD